MLDNLYQVPVLLLGLGAFVMLFAAAYTGFVLGQRKSGDETRELSRSAVAGVVGVVALLLAFTLGFALSRFQDRRASVVDEANAVMTAFLRADLLPAAERQELRATIRAYAATRDVSGTTDIAASVAASMEAQALLWPRAIALSEGRITGAERTLLLSAVNDVLDDHLERLAAATERVPLPVLGLAVLLAASAVFLSAYNEHSRKFPAPTFFMQGIGLAAVVMLILDFDNVSDGLIRIDNWIMASTVEDMDRIIAAAN